MKCYGLGVVALLAFSGLGLAAMGGDKCCGTQETAVKTPLIEKADGILVKFAEAFKTPPSEATMKNMAKAQETLGQICPVCKNMPDTTSFLMNAMRCSMDLEKTCEKMCKESGMAAKIPAEMKSMMAERGASLHKAVALLSAMDPKGGASKDSCCKEGSKDTAKAESCSKDATACTPEKMKDCFAKLSKNADELMTKWDGIPAQFNSLSAEDKTRLQGAIAIMKDSGAPCKLFNEGMVVSSQLIGRAVEIDSTLKKGCEKDGKDVCTGDMKVICDAFNARTELLKKTSALIAKMAKVTNPDPSNPMFAGTSN